MRVLPSHFHTFKTFSSNEIGAFRLLIGVVERECVFVMAITTWGKKKTKKKTTIKVYTSGNCATLEHEHLFVFCFYLVFFFIYIIDVHFQRYKNGRVNVLF